MSQNQEMASNAKRPREINDFALKVLTVVTAAGLLGIFVYAIQAISWAQFFSIVSVGLMVAGAVLVAGILLGFLFGLPRYLKQSGNQSESARKNQAEGELPKYETNTNLEEISDWLTKILVGVGLTQVAKVPGILQQTAEFLADGLGGFDSSEVFAVAILIFFSVCGFLIGYLWTRVHLPTTLSIADQLQEELRQEKDEKLLAKGETAKLLEDFGEKERKVESEKMIDKDIDKEVAREELGKLADEYMDTRRRMPRSSQRTVATTRIMARIIALCGKAEYECEELKLDFEKSEGQRMVVLGSLQANPMKECLDLITTAVTESRSGFEQYEALRAAQSVKEVLDEAQLPELRKAIESERKDGFIIPENAGRWNLSEQILGEMRR